MSDTIVATYTGIMYPPRNKETEWFVLRGPVTTEKNGVKSTNSSDKGFPLSLKGVAKTTVNKDGTVSVTVTEGKKGRPSAQPIANPAEFLNQ